MARNIAFPLVAGFVVSALSQTSCSDDEGGAGGFCERLGRECMAQAECEDVVERESIDHPGCEGPRDEMLDCAIEQGAWNCPDASTLYAGASYMSGGRAYDIQGYTLWLPTSCDDAGDAWERCNTCGPDDTRVPTTPPNASYAQSCEDCTMNGAILQCDLCYGTYAGASQIDVCSCTGDIANKDGHLCCDEACQD